MPSRLCGVGQPVASLATSFSGRAFCPCMLLADDFQSRAAGVGQADARAAAWLSVRFGVVKSWDGNRSASVCVGVGQPVASQTVLRLLSVLPASLLPFCAGVPAMGVGHPPAALSDVRGADARRAQIGGPDGISQCFQVSTNSGEPIPASLARNLLSKRDWRAALADEASELGPQVALVGGPASFAGGAEGLAGATPGPDGPVVRPSAQSKSEGPAADAREEVRLRVAA